MSSAPKSVSVLWALGSEPVVGWWRPPTGRRWRWRWGFWRTGRRWPGCVVGGVRSRVATGGLVVAGFVRRTSRDGDPQLHSHCLVPNLAQRVGDGRVVALDGDPLFEWCRAAGSIYQNELQRLLSLRLGVTWGPDRHNTREMVGVTADQLRVFSKRSTQIEAELERKGAVYESPALRMSADDEASSATRGAKDYSLTRSGWPAGGLGRRPRWAWRSATGWTGSCVGVSRTWWPRGWGELTAGLVDEEVGLCARDARFTEADVVEHLCAASWGRLTAEEMVSLGVGGGDDGQGGGRVGSRPDLSRALSLNWPST